MMTIREANQEDLQVLLRLYSQFGKMALAEQDPRATVLWSEILADKNHHVILGESAGELVSSCLLVIVPNLTHGGRPYGLIENVITDACHRNKGYATAVLQYAKAVAQGENCYKLMLMTGSKLPATLQFYERAGYNSTDKTAFIQWLE